MQCTLGIVLRSLDVFFYYSLSPHDVPEEPDDEPVDDLEEGDEAESEAETEETAHAGDEVDGSHPLDPLVLCKQD